MVDRSLGTRIIDAVNSRGPLLGRELIEALGDASYIDVWRACFSSGFLQISHFARYYLRFDVSREDHVRLSPSILRDFLTFTLISLPHQRDKVIARQIQLSNRHREISVDKLRVARRTLMSLSDGARAILREDAACFVAGDISYFLAHLEPRESPALGKHVNGSDIDIVIVLRDRVSEDRLAMIDSELLAAKHVILKSTNYREEIDFIVKTESRMRGQLRYTDIHDKIASKILYESLFLDGSSELFFELKESVIETGAEAKIEADFGKALDRRNYSMRELLAREEGIEDESIQSLFFFSQERTEFT